MNALASFWSLVHQMPLASTVLLALSALLLLGIGILALAAAIRTPADGMRRPVAEI